MNEMINQIVTDMQESDSTEDKIVINYNQPLTAEHILAIESLKKIKNPFAMVGVSYVMKDLKIGRSMVYKIFQRDDFPSINVGKSHTVMYLAYVIWKLNKKD